jgi:hypothetical protein
VNPGAERRSRRFPIHWVEALENLVSPMPGQKPRKVLLAICGKTRAAITLETHPLQSLVVHDAYLSETQYCEEGERCFNRDCPYNRTTVDSLARSLGFKRRPHRFQEVKPIPLGTDLQRHIDELCEQHPIDGVVSLFERPHS